MAGHPPVHQPERRLPVHRPATGILANGYPVPVAKIDNSPTDADESFTSPGTRYTVPPPASNRMLVLADRQDTSGGSLGSMPAGRRGDRLGDLVVLPADRGEHHPRPKHRRKRRAAPRVREKAAGDPFGLGDRASIHPCLFRFLVADQQY